MVGKNFLVPEKKIYSSQLIPESFFFWINICFSVNHIHAAVQRELQNSHAMAIILQAVDLPASVGFTEHSQPQIQSQTNAVSEPTGAKTYINISLVITINFDLISPNQQTTFISILIHWNLIFFLGRGHRRLWHHFSFCCWLFGLVQCIAECVWDWIHLWSSSHNVKTFHKTAKCKKEFCGPCQPRVIKWR